LHLGCWSLAKFGNLATNLLFFKLCSLVFSLRTLFQQALSMVGDMTAAQQFGCSGERQIPAYRPGILVVTEPSRYAAQSLVGVVQKTYLSVFLVVVVLDLCKAASGALH
jgi:hypothetical protein